MGRGTPNVAWAKAYLITKWHLDPSSRLTTTDIGQNWGLCPFWGREQGPRLAQCRLGRCLPPYQVASWSIQPFRHNRHEPKLGGLCSFWGGGRVLRPCQVSSFIQSFADNTSTLQTDRQDNGPIAWGEPFYKRSPKNGLDEVSASPCMTKCPQKGRGQGHITYF